MSMCDHDNVDVSRTVPCSGEPLDQLSRRKPLAQLFVFPRKRPIACIEQNQLLSRVHDCGNIGMLEPLGVDIVGPGKSMDFVRRDVCTVVGMQSFANCLGVENSSDLKLTKLESIDCRLQLAIQWSRHFHPPSVFRAGRMLSSWGRPRSRSNDGFLQSFIGFMITWSKSREIEDGGKTARIDDRQAQKGT